MLELDGIDAGYGDTTVLRNVSLLVPDGAVVALLGANGAGKTTLLRAASGLLPPSSGRIMFDGRDATREPRAPAGQARALSHPRGSGHLPDAQRAARTSRSTRAAGRSPPRSRWQSRPSRCWASG